MEMMRLLVLLAAATRAKELSFRRDGVELFRRVFDEDALEKLRRAWDAVEANETVVQSDVLEEGCVTAVARTTAARDPGAARRPRRRARKRRAWIVWIDDHDASQRRTHVPAGPVDRPRAAPTVGAARPE